MSESRAKWLTPAGLAEKIGVSTKTIYRRMNDGALPFLADGPRLRRIEPRVVELVLRYGLTGVARRATRGEI